jgi:hypothetical protein
MGDVQLAMQRAQDKTEQMQARATALEELVGSSALPEIGPAAAAVELGGGRGDPIGPPKTVLCPQCAKSNPIDAIFCANCRASLQPELVPPEYPSEDELVLSDYDREQKGSTNGIPRTSVTATGADDHPASDDGLIRSTAAREDRVEATSGPSIGSVEACSCGAVNPPNAHFCTTCGRALTGPPQAPRS